MPIPNDALPLAGFRASAPQLPDKITVLGVPIHNLNYAQAFERLEAMIVNGQPHQVVTINPEFLVTARGHSEFRAVLQRADLALADGVGLQFAAALQRRRFMMRVPGSELVYRLIPLAASRGWRLFFLGAKPGVAARAAAVLRARYPDIQIAVNGADPTAEHAQEALAQIRQFRPHILLVAYGAPTQDLWIARHRTAAAVPVMMGVGGTLDFIAGTVRRPPPIWHTWGLEWLYRLWQQPWRWRRQLKLPLFVLLVLLERVGRGS